MDPGLGCGVRDQLGGYRADAVQHAGHVPPRAHQRVHDHLDVGLLPVEFHGHRVDQVGHVGGDDVHHDSGATEGRVARVPYLHQGTALWPARGERGVPGRDGGDLGGAGRDQVLGCDVPVVGAEEAGDVADRPAGITGRSDPALPAGPGRRCPGEQFFPCLVRTFRHYCPLLRVHPGERVPVRPWTSIRRQPASLQRLRHSRVTIRLPSVTAFGHLCSLSRVTA
jgi:hypothetical protein